MVNKKLKATIHILSNILRIKSTQTMRLSQLKIFLETLFFRYHAENEAGRLVSDLFLFFEKTLHEVKASALQLSFNKFR